MTDVVTGKDSPSAGSHFFSRLGAAVALPNSRSHHIGDLGEDGAIERIAEECGVFATLDQAVAAANEAFSALNKMSLEVRFDLVRAMRKTAWANAEYLAALCVKESGMGRMDSKTLKNRLVAAATPGPEALSSHVSTGDYGLSLMERAPWGTIGSITPVTNAATSIINHGLSMVAAGNSVVFNAHPRAAAVSARAMQLLNKAVVEAGGPPNLLTCCAVPTLESAKALMVHSGIDLLVVTGGEAVVAEGMRSGKPVIAAGPGNPPVVVDDTADIPRAARDIVIGAGFDNNLVCILEKEIIAVDSIADDLVVGLKKEGAYELTSWQAQRLSNVILEENLGAGRPSVVNKRWVGQDASVILREIGVEVGPEVKLIIMETPWDHPFVLTEMLMPVIPVVRVPTVDEAIDVAIAVERGFRHTAVMHSTNIQHMTRMARAVDTTIFVKNGPSLAGLGHEGQGFSSMTIATPTGHGIVGPIAYTRQRRCVLVDYLRIV